MLSGPAAHADVLGTRSAFEYRERGAPHQLGGGGGAGRIFERGEVAEALSSKRRRARVPCCHVDVTDVREGCDDQETGRTPDARPCTYLPVAARVASLAAWGPRGTPLASVGTAEGASHFGAPPYPQEPDPTTWRGAFAGLVIGKFLKPVYQAQATIWIQAADQDRDRGRGDQGPIQSARLLGTSGGWLDLIRSHVVLNDVRPGAGYSYYAYSLKGYSVRQEDPDGRAGTLLPGRS